MSDEAIVPLVIELIEKVGLLRRELQHNQDLDKYEGRIARIEQKIEALADQVSRAGPEPGVSQRRAPEGPVRHVVRVGGRCPLIYPFSPTV
jgi:hypothetical protein